MLYLAGPMTGMPAYNLAGFTAGAAALRAAGFEVFNPIEADINIDKFNPETDVAHDFIHYMRRDLAAVMESAGVAVLEGWEASKGASLEVHVARECSLPVRTVGEWIATTQRPEEVNT